MNSSEIRHVELPWPAENTNKYARGKLTVVAGSARYSGAAVLAALASQRMGAGYTEVVTDPAAVNVVRIASPSLVVRSTDEWKPGELAQSIEGKPCAVCVGPGFAPDDEKAAELVARVLKKAPCPVVVDGGGLARLATKKNLQTLADRFGNGLATVITPHGGEAARLAKSLGLPTGNQEHLAAALSLSTQAIVVLKGPDTYISNGKTTECMKAGTPALAKAGTGDVLAGMIAALLAQGMDPFGAAALGASLHALAGTAAAEAYTEISVVAEDVIAAIPQAIRTYQSA